MTSFLLIISFLLHIIMIYAIYSLHQQVQEGKLKEKEAIENILAQFLDELHKENEILASELRQPQLKKNEPYEKSHINKEERLEKIEEEHVSFAPILDQLIDEKRADIIDTSIEASMIKMYENGEKIEEIAKKLNRGKTEVELIVKLHRKNE